MKVEEAMAETIIEQQRTIRRMRLALERIAKWFGEFPAVEDSHNPGGVISYGYAYGTNGERDFMRKIAKEALTDDQG